MATSFLIGLTAEGSVGLSGRGALLLGGSKGDVAQEGLPRLSEGPKSSAWKVMALVTAADRQQCDEVHRLLRAGPRPSLPDRKSVV